MKEEYLSHLWHIKLVGLSPPILSISPSNLCVEFSQSISHSVLPNLTSLSSRSKLSMHMLIFIEFQSFCLFFGELGDRALRSLFCRDAVMGLDLMGVVATLKFLFLLTMNVDRIT